LSTYPPLVLNLNNSKHIHTLNLLKVFLLIKNMYYGCCCC
jgi:hypothetical protein